MDCVGVNRLFGTDREIEGLERPWMAAVDVVESIENGRPHGKLVDCRTRLPGIRGTGGLGESLPNGMPWVERLNLLKNRVKGVWRDRWVEDEIAVLVE